MGVVVPRVLRVRMIHLKSSEGSAIAAMLL